MRLPKTILLCGLFLLPLLRVAAAESGDRTYWCRMAHRVAFPVLDAFSRGEFVATMPLEVKPGSEQENELTRLEALGRTLCGIAPWLESGTGSPDEERLRAELTRLALEALRRVVDPDSPDRYRFRPDSRQQLVDAAFLAQGLLRAPTALWAALDMLTQRRVIDCLLDTRSVRPWNSNWLLFPAVIEAFLLSAGEQADMMRIDYAVRQHEAWYKGGGVYGDGALFHADYYNSFVIQPMLIDILTLLNRLNIPQEGSSGALSGDDYYQRLLSRSTHYATILERMISPDGSYPPVGRSLIYRIGAFQSLGQMALMHRLSEEVAPAQVRCALTAVIRRQMDAPGTFGPTGWLRIGFCGAQPSVGEGYITTESLYLCCAGFLPLGLPESDPFWSDPPAPWTQVKMWGGEDMRGGRSIYY